MCRWLAKEKKHIKEQLDKAGSYNDMQGILKQYDIYSRQLEEKKHAYEEKLEAVGGFLLQGKSVLICSMLTEFLIHIAG